MKKTYNAPQCDIVRLNVSQSILDNLFGNDSKIPVGNVPGDDGGHDGYVDEMYGKSSAGSSLWDD